MIRRDLRAHDSEHGRASDPLACRIRSTGHPLSPHARSIDAGVLTTEGVPVQPSSIEVRLNFGDT